MPGPTAAWHQHPYLRVRTDARAIRTMGAMTPHDRRAGPSSGGEPGVEPLGLLRRYLRRRTPWDAPWWLYVVTIGAANIARQLLFPEMPTAVRIATFAVMVLGVGLLVTVAHRTITDRPTRRSRPSRPAT